MLILLPPSEKKLPTDKPTPAMNVYAGVLYQALDWGSLSPAAKKRGETALAIISAKYGVVRPTQRIESYKEKIDNKAMREPVAAVLDPIKTGLIVDCRSSTYKTVWHSPVDITVEVRVSTVVDGVRAPCRRRLAAKLRAGCCSRVQCQRLPKISMQLFQRNIPALLLHRMESNHGF